MTTVVTVAALLSMAAVIVCGMVCVTVVVVRGLPSLVPLMRYVALLRPAEARRLEREVSSAATPPPPATSGISPSLAVVPSPVDDPEDAAALSFMHTLWARQAEIERMLDGAAKERANADLHADLIKNAPHVRRFDQAKKAGRIAA